jgi:hypothetical protein
MISKLVPFAAVTALLAALPQARAQPFEDTYVSAAGSDANLCTRLAPCITVGRALGLTALNGQVTIIDSGDFPAFTITQPVAVRAAQGVFATITATSGTAVTISAGTNDTVTLGHLHIFGFGQQGVTGVQVNSAGIVHIGHCGVASFSGTGIVVAPSANGTSGSLHFVLDHGNVSYNAAGNVLIMPTGSGSVFATIEHELVHHSSNGYGIKFDTETTTGPVYGQISNSNIAYHAGSAVNAHSGTANANVVVDHSVIHFDSRAAGAVYADGAAAGVALNFSEIANTVMAWGTANGGKTYSYGNNAVNFNTNASSPTNPITLQ